MSFLSLKALSVGFYFLYFFLKAGVPDPPEMEARLTAEKEKQRLFLEQLMDSSKLESYKVSIPVDAELRKYQQVQIGILISMGLRTQIYLCGLFQL